MLELVAKILEQQVCNSCLGRQFGKLGSGYTNEQRGRILRDSAAMMIDANKLDASKVDRTNFSGYKFRNNPDFVVKDSKFSCEICDGLFSGGIEKLAKKAALKLKGGEFKTFLVGSRLSKKLSEKEEHLWMRVGIDYCEPLKNEINREVGKAIEKLVGKKADLKKPDVAIIINLDGNKIELKNNPLYVFGFYQKLVRGIPQAKWEKYHKTSVEHIIGKPMLKASGAAAHTIHAAGREDVDARCLAWRPFVFELTEPKKRVLDLKRIEKDIAKTKKVKVKDLKIVDNETVPKVKNSTPDKSYRALVMLDKPVKRSDVSKLKSLVGKIEQRTPQRVAHRRADLTRSRVVHAMSWKLKGSKKLELIIDGSSGLYIKELISGDDGRTKPSVSEVLGRKAVCKELDVIRIGKIAI